MDLLLPPCLDVLQVLLKLNEFLRLISLVGEHLLDALYVVDDLTGLLRVSLEHLLDHAVDELLACVDKVVVQIVAFDQEHAHANLVRGRVLDFLNRIQVELDALLVLLTIAVGVAAELSNSLRLLKDEQVVVVDIDGLGDISQVLEKDVSNLFLSSLDNLVLRVDHPQVGLLWVSDLSIGARNVVDGLNHMLNELDKDILDSSQSVLLLFLLILVFLCTVGSLKDNLRTLNLHLQGQESLLEFAVRVVLTLDDLLWQRVVSIFFAETPLIDRK